MWRGSKIFQTPTTPPQSPIPQLSFAEWLGVFAFIISISITLFELYQRYYKGSDIRLIVNRRHKFNVFLGEDSSLELRIPMIFVNNGSRSGVVTYFNAERKEPPEFVEGGGIYGFNTPISIKERDCLSEELILKFDLKDETYRRLKESGGNFRFKTKVFWKRTHPTGRFFKKIKIENKLRTEEIEVLCMFK